MNRRRKTSQASRAKKKRPRRKGRAFIPITARDRLAGKWFAKLMALQARLYAPGGCPWDREQTHESLRKFLIEETYEVLDAMDSGDPRKFSGEMGDLLLQIVFHSILAEEAGRFTISDVIESVHSKMIRRHPHVFGDEKASHLRCRPEKLGADKGRGACCGREVSSGRLPQGFRFHRRFRPGRSPALASRRSRGLSTDAPRFAHWIRLG